MFSTPYIFIVLNYVIKYNRKVLFSVCFFSEWAREIVTKAEAEGLYHFGLSRMFDTFFALNTITPPPRKPERGVNLQDVGSG